MLWQHNHERKRFPVALLKKHIWKMWWAQFPSFKQEKKNPASRRQILRPQHRFVV